MYSKRSRAALALALVGWAAVPPMTAQAQSIAAFVDSEPITSYDVDQRMKINRLGRQPSSRQAVLSELIDDKVKLAEARRMGYRIPESYADEQIQRQAKQNRQTLVEFNQTLNRAGIDMNAYRQKLMGGYAWELILERRARAGAQQGDPLFHSGGGGARVTDYTLYSVVFVVPRGEGAGARGAQANAARARFNDCTTGLAALRATTDVAVRSPVRRSSDSLSPQMAKMLAATPVNRMTQAFPSDQGIEMIAVCEKTERFDSTARAANEADERKKAADAASYLKSLRAKSVIRGGR